MVTPDAVRACGGVRKLAGMLPERAGRNEFHRIPAEPMGKPVQKMVCIHFGMRPEFHPVAIRPAELVPDRVRGHGGNDFTVPGSSADGMRIVRDDSVVDVHAGILGLIVSVVNIPGKEFRSFLGAYPVLPFGIQHFGDFLRFPERRFIFPVRFPIRKQPPFFADALDLVTAATGFSRITVILPMPVHADLSDCVVNCRSLPGANPPSAGILSAIVSVVNISGKELSRVQDAFDFPGDTRASFRKAHHTDSQPQGATLCGEFGSCAVNLRAVRQATHVKIAIHEHSRSNVELRIGDLRGGSLNGVHAGILCGIVSVVNRNRFRFNPVHRRWYRNQTARVYRCKCIP
jgi:hypothetical protein